MNKEIAEQASNSVSGNLAGLKREVELHVVFIFLAL
jgi:hypothetical protein